MAPAESEETPSYIPAGWSCQNWKERPLVQTAKSTPTRPQKTQQESFFFQYIIRIKPVLPQTINANTSKIQLATTT
jgi:hypothetical protein